MTWMHGSFRSSISWKNNEGCVQDHNARREYWLRWLRIASLEEHQKEFWKCYGGDPMYSRSSWSYGSGAPHELALAGVIGLFMVKEGQATAQADFDAGCSAASVDGERVPMLGGLETALAVLSAALQPFDAMLVRSYTDSVRILQPESLADIYIMLMKVSRC